MHEEHNVITDELFCDNPRCISSVEQELSHVFKIIDKNSGECRCIYCEAKKFR